MIPLPGHLFNEVSKVGLVFVLRVELFGLLLVKRDHLVHGDLEAALVYLL